MYRVHIGKVLFSIICSKNYQILYIIKELFCLGVYIQLRGVRLSNNSEVFITDIGEGDTASVLCFTDKTDCCRTFDGYRGPVGEWYFPNESTVGILGYGGSFYRNRGQSVVRLHRRHNVMMPTGPFCCEVPDANDITQRICIAVKASPCFLSIENMSPTPVHIAYTTMENYLSCFTTPVPSTETITNTTVAEAEKSTAMITTIAYTTTVPKLLTTNIPNPFITGLTYIIIALDIMCYAVPIAKCTISVGQVDIDHIEVKLFINISSYAYYLDYVIHGCSL